MKKWMCSEHENKYPNEVYGIIVEISGSVLKDFHIICHAT